MRCLRINPTFHLLVLAFLVLAASACLANDIVIYGTGAVGGRGLQDLNYLLVQAPPGVSTPINPYQVTYPPWVLPPQGLWWDSTSYPPNAEPYGEYVYRTTFDLTGLGPKSAVLTGIAAADDAGEIWLNGKKVAVMGGYTAPAPFTIASGVNGAEFLPGVNTLEFHVQNLADNSVTGLLVQIRGTAWPTAQTGGSWSPVRGQFPGSGAGSSLLLTDGRVLVHEEQNHPENWYILTPDQYGDYAKGTWSTAASLTTLTDYCYAPLAFASAVLPDGRVIVEGGEFNIPPGCQQTNLTNKGAIYDPRKNTWATVDPPPNWATIGDAQSTVLPDGTFMLANCCTTEQAEMSAPYTGGNSWVPTGNFKSTINDEEGWTLLPGPPDSEILLTVGTSVGCNNTANNSELYINGYWFCIANTPTQLWDNNSHEMGPAVLRPDGTVFQAGGTTALGTGQSAIFQSYYLQWTQGPNFPTDSQGNQLDISDGPAALLPNGNVLMMTSPGNGLAGAIFFELQYGTDQLVKVSAPPNAVNDAAFYGHMLLLPTGQILFTDFSQDVEIYTPTYTRVVPSWVPRVKTVNGEKCVRQLLGCVLIVHNQSTNVLEGFQLNGMSQAVAYGDDYQAATNYPLLRLTEVQLCPYPGCAVPARVYYCRTHDHSSMGVATGNLLVSTEFDCAKVPEGAYDMEVVANGIPGSPGLGLLGNVRVRP